MEVRVLDDRYDALNRFILFQSYTTLPGISSNPAKGASG